MSDPWDWSTYLADFHSRHAGVTEQVLSRSRIGGKEGTDPYRWLASQVDPGGAVLDVACGGAPLHRELGAGEYLGVDVSAAELAVAAQRGVPVVRADAAHLPLPGCWAETVTCSMGLMLLPVAQWLDEARRVVRPGGRLVATVPATGPLTGGDRLAYGRLLVALRLTGLRYPGDTAMRNLGRLMPAAGFTVVSDRRRRFVYRLDSAAAGTLLLDSLYLPGVPARRRRRAERLVHRWVGREIGIPIRLVVAVADPPRTAPADHVVGRRATSNP